MVQAVTLEKWAEIANGIKPLPFLAFTMRPAIYSAFRSQVKPHPFDGYPILGGVEIYCLTLQDEDVLQWSDKELLREYLKAHDALLGYLDEPDQQEQEDRT